MYIFSSGNQQHSSHEQDYCFITRTPMSTVVMKMAIPHFVFIHCTTQYPTREE